MRVRLKPISEQTIVITGASSGIGLCTAREAARRGANVVLFSRSGEQLRQLCDEIRRSGGEACEVVGDVGREEDLRRLSQVAIERYGRIDSWINNAGVSIYGKLDDVSVTDMRHLFDTNFWGVVLGSRIALEGIRETGGAIINIGSILSEISMPLQGIYSASKHAVKGFTDTLRMEVETDQLPVSVTLIEPAAIDTPYTEHAANYMAREPKNPAPNYSPDAVTDAILFCCENPRRSLVVGGAGKLLTITNRLIPRLTERLIRQTMSRAQFTNRTSDWDRHRSLHEPSGELRERGSHHGVLGSSLYTRSAMHPILTAAVALGTGAAVAALFRGGHQHR